MATPPKAGTTLLSRNVRLLLAGQAASVLGDRMTMVALAFAVLEIGGGASQIGLVLAAQTAPLMATLLIGGVVADRLPRRAVLVASDVVRCVCQGIIAALLLAGVAEVWMLAALAGLSGLATGFFSPASTGLLPELVSGALMQKANALRASVNGASQILGPAIAGILIAVAGAGPTFLIDAATFAISAATLVALRLPPHRREATTGFARELADGWNAFRSRRWVWSTVLYFGAANLMWGAWSVLGPLVAEAHLGGAAAWGGALTAIGAGTLVGSVIANRVDPGRPLLVVAAMEGLLAIPLALLASEANLVLLAVAAFISGLGETIGMSVWDSTLQRQIPIDALGRVSSYDYLGSLIFVPAGMVLWGPLSVALGIDTALWLAFGLMLTLVAILAALPDTRGLRRRLEPA